MSFQTGSVFFLPIVVIFCIGEETKVLCIAEGYPAPKIEWRRDMHEIEEKKGEISWSERVSILNKGNKIVARVYAVLTIKKTDRDVQISCKAKNAAGKGVASVQLVIHDLPVAPCKFEGLFSRFHLNVFI